MLWMTTSLSPLNKATRIPLSVLQTMVTVVVDDHFSVTIKKIHEDPLVPVLQTMLQMTVICLSPLKTSMIPVSLFFRQ